jgi:hypothetical protein
MNNEFQYPKQEILALFGITESQLKKFRKLGAPAAEGKGIHARWPVLALAQWIVEEWPYHHQQDPEVRQKAAHVLRENGLLPSRPEPDTTQPPEGCLGLEAALARLRQAESETYNRWMAALQADDPSQAQYFKAWQQALDLLRKAEGNLLEVLERRRDLLPADEVRTWMSRQVEVAKATLLDLPGKLAPSLENLPWSEIQKTLDQEIRHALSRLSDSPQ